MPGTVLTITNGPCVQVYNSRTMTSVMASNASEIQTLQYRLKSSLFSQLPPTGPHLGPGWKGNSKLVLATIQTGSHHFLLISVEPAYLCSVCNACEDWSVCGQFFAMPAELTTSNTLCNGGMSRSIWPNIGH
jgi:hypothetical protein